jgi:hypothetical protein
MPRKRREIHKQMTRKQLLDVTASNLKMAADLLRVHEVKWKEAWNAAPNPFLAFEQHMKNKPARVKIINQWLKARKEYYDARH